MAYIHNNDIILTAKEAKQLNQQLDQITTIQELIELMKYYYNLAGVTLELNWDPQFQLYKEWNNIIPAFVGHISGRNINQSGNPYPEVYSISCITEGMSTFGNLFRIETSNGGGGNNWRYSNGRIDIRKFPAMAKLYGEQISEALIEDAKLKFQKQYDDELETIDKSLSSYESQVRYSNQIKSIENRIKEITNLLEKVKLARDTLIEQQIAEKASHVVLPKAQSPFISLYKYNQIANRLSLKPFAQIQHDIAQSNIDTAIEEFINKHPELFI